MKNLLKIGNVIKLKKQYHTPVDKRGGKFELYCIEKINKINIRARNLATGGKFILRKDNIE